MQLLSLMVKKGLFLDNLPSWTLFYIMSLNKMHISYWWWIMKTTKSDMIETRDSSDFKIKKGFLKRKTSKKKMRGVIYLCWQDDAGLTKFDFQSPEVCSTHRRALHHRYFRKIFQQIPFSKTLCKHNPLKYLTFQVHSMIGKEKENF